MHKLLAVLTTFRLEDALNPIRVHTSCIDPDQHLCMFLYIMVYICTVAADLMSYLKIMEVLSRCVLYGDGVDDNDVGWSDNGHLTLMLGKNFSRRQFEIFFLFFHKISFDISCKLSPQETICIKCQRFFLGKIRKKISSICRLLKFAQ